MKRTLLLTLSVLCVALLAAQDTARIDSLLGRLTSLGQDTMRLHTLAALSAAYGQDPKANSVDDEIIALAGVLGTSSDAAVQRAAWRAEADATMSASARRNAFAATPSMLPSARHALELYTRLGDPRLQAYALTLLAAIHYNQGDAATWMRLTQQAIGLQLSVGDSSLLLNSWSMFASIHRERGEYDEALAYLRKGLAHSQRMGRSVLVLKATADMAEAYFERGDLDSAALWNDRAMAMARTQGLPSFQAIAMMLQARMAEQRGDLRSALNLYAAADSTSPPAGITANGTRSARAVRDGLLRLKLGEVQAALALGLEGLALARTTGFPSAVEAAAALLRDVYLKLDRPRDALAMWQLQAAMRDSLNSQEAAEAILRFEFRQTQLTDSLTNASQREHDRLESEVRLARERTGRNIFLFSGLGLLVFGLVVFRQRNRIKKEHGRSEELLLNILPQEVAEELKTKGHAEAKHFDKVTILFTDFKGFTQASERMSPQELVEELNTCFKVFDGIITARGIEKIKTIGDAYMCAGGLPVPASSTPAGVVHAALEMQAFMVSRKKERDALGKPAFAMRVGIHTGPVVAGIVGVKKFAYDIWGDTVNIASRMESSGEVGQVNISEATYALVKDEPGLTFTSRGKVQAKGKGELEMYFVEGKPAVVRQPADYGG